MKRVFLLFFLSCYPCKVKFSRSKTTWVSFFSFDTLKQPLIFLSRMFTSKILPEGYNEDEPPDSSGDNPKVLDLEVELKVLGFNDFQEALNVSLSLSLSLSHPLSFSLPPSLSPNFIPNVSF